MIKPACLVPLKNTVEAKHSLPFFPSCGNKCKLLFMHTKTFLQVKLRVSTLLEIIHLTGVAYEDAD